MNSDLYYVDNISGKALPNWGEFFIRLGYKIVQLNENNKRTIIAIAVPTRAFSAALISFGVVVSLASNNKQITKSIYHGDQQFKYFSHLKTGTTLLIRSENKLISGIFTGCTVDKNDGIVKVGVKLPDKSTGYCVSWFPSHMCLQIPEANGSSAIHLPHIITENLSFINHFIPDEAIQNFLINSQIDCVITGKIGALKQEIFVTPFIAKSIDSELAYEQNEYNQGTIQDVIRVQRFNNLAPHTEIYPVDIPASQINIEHTRPFVTIFDGVNGFIKFREKFRNSNWIVILDRTEQRFRDAANIIDHDYLDRLNSQPFMLMDNIPSGLEMIAFQDSK